jgi:hypothetical protein
MSVSLGKLNEKLLHAGHPHGDESLPLALRHLYLLACNTLELLFQLRDKRSLFSLGALGVAALSGLPLVLFRGPAWTYAIFVLRGSRGGGGRFRNPRGVDLPYLLSMLKESFMSRANTIVCPGGKMPLAMQLVFTPMIWKLMERQRKTD